MSKTPSSRSILAGLVILAFAAAAAPDARAQGRLSLDVGAHSANRLFALASNDSPLPAEVRAFEVRALDGHGQVLFQFQKLLAEPRLIPPGLARFVTIPLPPTLPASAIVAFEALLLDGAGLVVAQDAYRSDVGVVVDRYDADTGMLYVKFTNKTDSTISITSVDYKKYEPRHIVPGTVRLRPAQNVAPGATTEEICLAITLGEGHSVVLKAVDPEGTVVGKGSFTR